MVRWNMISQTYDPMSRRFDTYPEAETFGTECHRRAIESKRMHYRFIPISVERYQQGART